MVSSLASATSQEVANGASSVSAASALGVMASSSAAEATHIAKNRWNVRCVAILFFSPSEAVATRQGKHEILQALARNCGRQRAFRNHRPIVSAIELVLRFARIADDDEEDVVHPNLREF